MKLPTIQSPVYPITLPDSKKEVTIRQLLTGEYKALMKAYVMGDRATIASTLAAIIPNCISGNVSFDDLSFVDVEFLFLKLYSVGVDSSLKVQLTCTKQNADGNPCNTAFGVQVPIDEIVPTDVPSGKIQLTDNAGIVLKYPRWKEWFSNDKQSDDEILFDIVEKVWVDDAVLLPGVDFSKQELAEWIDSMPADKVVAVTAFVEAMPTVSWTREVTCPKCGNKDTIRLVGLADFLD